MKVTLDLDTNIITVPKNYFEVYAKQNAQIEKLGGTKINPVEVIKKSFEIAINNTDSYLVTRK